MPIIIIFLFCNKLYWHIRVYLYTIRKRSIIIEKFGIKIYYQTINKTKNAIWTAASDLNAIYCRLYIVQPKIIYRILQLDNFNGGDGGGVE